MGSLGQTRGNNGLGWLHGGDHFYQQGGYFVPFVPFVSFVFPFVFNAQSGQVFRCLLRPHVDNGLGYLLRADPSGQGALSQQEDVSGIQGGVKELHFQFRV